MNRKRGYLCLVLERVTEKIINKKTEQVEITTSLRVTAQGLNVSVTFFNEHSENFTITLYEFQSYKFLRILRKEILRYLEHDELVLSEIRANESEKLNGK